MDRIEQAPSLRAEGGVVASGGGEVALKLLVQGFTQPEWQMLEALVRLSQRRHPRITLIGPADAASADVVLIDAADDEAKKWADSQPWLQNRAVIWVDATDAPDRTVVKRPMQWSALPVLMASMLEKTPSLASEKLASANPSTASLGQAAGGLAETDAAFSTNRAGSASVLVVDDSLAIRSLLRSLLESHDLKVTDVDNAEAALKAAAATDYECVLLDVLMPGMDGYEACRQIKGNAHGGKVPAVVMLTSKSSSFDRIKGKMAGCDAYLTKPIDPDYLSEIILRHITKSTGANSDAAIRATPSPYAG